MPGKFVIKKGSTGKFRFNLVSTNGQVVATSEAYERKASALAGIRPDPEAFIEALDSLQPRLYSIASSPKTNPRRVALLPTVTKRR